MFQNLGLTLTLTPGAIVPGLGANRFGIGTSMLPFPSDVDVGCIVASDHVTYLRLVVQWASLPVL